MSACLKLCVSLSSLFTLVVSPYLLQIILSLLQRFIHFSFLARRDFVVGSPQTECVIHCSLYVKPAEAVSSVITINITTFCSTWLRLAVDEEENGSSTQSSLTLLTNTVTKEILSAVKLHVHEDVDMISQIKTFPWKLWRSSSLRLYHILW